MIKLIFFTLWMYLMFRDKYICIHSNYLPDLHHFHNVLNHTSLKCHHYHFQHCHFLFLLLFLLSLLIFHCCPLLSSLPPLSLCGEQNQKIKSERKSINIMISFDVFNNSIVSLYLNLSLASSIISWSSSFVRATCRLESKNITLL